jgi:PKD repeat protein
MKQIYITIVSIVFSAFASAQITITQSDMPAAPLLGQADSLRYSTASIATSNIDVTQTGANFNWNFSNLQPSGQGLTEYKSSAQTLYSVFGFGFTAIGLKQPDLTFPVQGINLGFTDVYDFYNSTSSKFETKGTGLTITLLPKVGLYTDPDVIYNLPLNFADHDSDTFRYYLDSLSFPGIPLAVSYLKKGSRVNTVDGWGSITTPFGTFNCIRVKSVVTEIDSIMTGFFNFPFPNNRVEYKWLAKTTGSIKMKIPVLEVIGTETAGVFTPTSIKYRDIYRNLKPVPDFVADETNPYRWVPVNFTNNTTSASTATTQYQWSISPTGYHTFENSTSQTSANPSISFTLDTVFTVQLKATNTSGSDSIIKTNYIKVKKEIQSVSEVEKNQLQIFPNPAIDHLLMSCEANEKITSVRIFDLQGKLVQTQNVSNAQPTLVDIKMLSKGEYIIEAIGKTKVYHKNFVKFD